MIRDLVEIVAHYALFLELADDSALTLENIVRQQEDLAARLHRLSPDDRQQFLRLLSEVATGLPREEERQILIRLPHETGLA